MAIKPRVGGRCLKAVIFSLGIFAATMSGAAYGCESNFDCELGSRCVKAKGQSIGICFGGMDPGNKNDQKPGRLSSGTTEGIGDTCWSNLDCDLGARCVKSGGMEGVCLKEK